MLLCFLLFFLNDFFFLLMIRRNPIYRLDIEKGHFLLSLCNLGMIYTQPKKYSYTHLFAFFNYLDSYLTYMFGIFLKAIQFPVHWGVDHVATIIVRDTRAGWLTYPLKVKVTKYSPHLQCWRVVFNWAIWCNGHVRGKVWGMGDTLVV